MQKSGLVRQSVTVNSPFALVVVDVTGRLHISLTTFYHQLKQQLANRIAKIYLYSMLAFFTYLTMVARRDPVQYFQRILVLSDEQDYLKPTFVW